MAKFWGVTHTSSTGILYTLKFHCLWLWGLGSCVIWECHGVVYYNSESSFQKYFLPFICANKWTHQKVLLSEGSIYVTMQLPEHTLRATTSFVEYKYSLQSYRYTKYLFLIWNLTFSLHSPLLIRNSARDNIPSLLEISRSVHNKYCWYKFTHKSHLIGIIYFARHCIFTMFLLFYKCMYT